MNLGLIRTLSEKRAGGMRKLASDIEMSEANLHRCVNNNKIQAADLEKIARLLNVDIRVFFDEDVVKPVENTDTHNNASNDYASNRELVALCKALVANYQQRDDVMHKLVSMVKCME